MRNTSAERLELIRFGVGVACDIEPNTKGAFEDLIAMIDERDQRIAELEAQLKIANKRKPVFEIVKK